jgi:hypothetical protein
MVEKGHRIIKRNAQGQLYDTGKMTKPVRFASGSLSELETQGDLASEAILKHVIGE